MERTVVMDKSKGEFVISVKITSRFKERVSIVFVFVGSSSWGRLAVILIGVMIIVFLFLKFLVF